ncbi:MAG: hypothetical protein CSA39_03530 [Flavobacteriales bacterium]|nr:MAG: hypothetical protein CR985_01920 [Flavobacteriales bacterium]PIE49282.1 MAG: hypothetical protein CSA39_03530 [Flavobacteriales bacterium]
MNLLINDCVDQKIWLDLLGNNKFASPFQTPQFYQFYNTISGYKADVFAVEDNEQYKALMVVTVQKEKGLKSIFSVRGIVYGGPLLENENEQTIKMLLEGIKKFYKNKLIYLEIRNHFSYKAYKPIFKKMGYKFQPHLNVQQHLSDYTPDNILSKLGSNKRREVRLSIKAGAKVRITENEEEIETLYHQLAEMYAERVKLPLPDLSFFKKLSFSDIGKTFLVEHEGNIIGGAFCIYYEGLSINTFYYVGQRGYHRNIHPTQLAIYGVLQYAVENNLKMLDFMGAGKPNVDYGVRRFKLQFGGNLEQDGRFLKVFKPINYEIGKLGVSLMQLI